MRNGLLEQDISGQGRKTRECWNPTMRGTPAAGDTFRECGNNGYYCVCVYIYMMIYTTSRTIDDSAYIHHIIRKRIQNSRRTMRWQTVTCQVYCHISALWKREQSKLWQSNNYLHHIHIYRNRGKQKRSVLQKKSITPPVPSIQFYNMMLIIAEG